MAVKTLAFLYETNGKLVSVSDIDAKTVAITSIYTVPSGFSLVVTGVIVRVTSFTVGSKTVQAVVSFGGNSATYDDYINSGTYTVAAAAVGIQDRPMEPASPIYAAGMDFKLSIETGSNATTETWAIDLFGYLV